jgi:transcriptional regulator with XRE-family HTH domain
MTTDLTPAQCRAARGLIEWSQEQLAAAANVGISTVRDFEGSRRSPRAENLEAIRKALERAGATLIAAGDVSTAGGAGVRLKKR